MTKIMKNRNGNVKHKTKHLVTRKAGRAAIEVSRLKIYLKISMVVVFIHLVLKVHLPERTEIFICTTTSAWYQASTQRGCGGAFVSPFGAHYFKIMQFLVYTPISDPKMVIFLKIRTLFSIYIDRIQPNISAKQLYGLERYKWLNTKRT